MRADQNNILKLPTSNTNTNKQGLLKGTLTSSGQETLINFFSISDQIITLSSRDDLDILEDFDLGLELSLPSGTISANRIPLRFVTFNAKPFMNEYVFEIMPCCKSAATNNILKLMEIAQAKQEFAHNNESNHTAKISRFASE